jgi:hypothetical protein
MLTSRRIAIAMILAGVVLFVGSWSLLATRKLVPLDVPVSLSRGHIRSGFEVNLDAGYLIEIEVEDRPPIDNLDCLMWGCNNAPAILKARWTLSSDGRIEVTGNSDDNGRCCDGGRIIGAFRSDGGQSTIDVDVLSDTNVLNKAHPRLRIEADAGGYRRVGRLREGLAFVSAIIVAAGVIVLLLANAKERAEHPIALGVSPNPAKAHCTPDSRRTLPRKALFAGLPTFGLYTVLILITLALCVSVLRGLNRSPAHGILVLTSSRKLRTPRLDQLVSPLVLRIDKKNQWFLNGELVSRDQFPDALKHALSRRPDWVLYLVADGDLEFLKAATAIDTIQALHARVILGPPKVERPARNAH